MQDIDGYIDQVKSLPPAPAILPELLSLLGKDDVDSDRIVKLITFDPGLTAALLRTCNSAFLAGAEPVGDVNEAVVRLGFRQVFQLVAATTGSKVLGQSQQGYGIDAGELWEHSVTAAVAAQLMAREGGADESVVFTATLVHDIGKVVLTEAIEKTYAEVIASSRSDGTSLVEIEKKVLGFHHGEVGGRLLARWKFPANIVNAVTHHHNPAQAKGHEKLAAHVYLGNMVAYFMGFGYGHQAFALTGRNEALELAGIKPESLPVYMIKTFEQLATIRSLVNIKS
jgi:putative nucleotidyltransferase with HDIG domain